MDTVIARLGKPHGIKGEFTVEVRTDRPEEQIGRASCRERV